jgi:hypothetical protein
MKKLYFISILLLIFISINVQSKNYWSKELTGVDYLEDLDYYGHSYTVCYIDNVIDYERNELGGLVLK